MANSFLTCRRTSIMNVLNSYAKSFFPTNVSKPTNNEGWPTGEVNLHSSRLGFGLFMYFPFFYYHRELWLIWYQIYHLQIGSRIINFRLKMAHPIWRIQDGHEVQSGFTRVERFYNFIRVKNNVKNLLLYYMFIPSDFWSVKKAEDLRCR